MTTATNLDTTKDKVKSNGTKRDNASQDNAPKDSTVHNITGTTLDTILLDYINGRSTVKQRIISVSTIAQSNGGGLRIETEDGEK